MARDTEDIAAITGTVSLQRLIESKGTPLRKKGTLLVASCPLHPATRKPSALTLNVSANTWSCPTCKVKDATVIDWIERAEGVSRRHAIDLLRSDFGAPVGPQSRSKTAKKLDAFAELDELDDVVAMRVLDYYAETLKQSPEALAYLQQRRLVHADLLDTFKLGYSNRTLGYRMPPKNRKQGFLLRSQLERIGIQRRSGHEHYWGAITFPVIDERGSLQQVYGRKILGDTRLKKGTPLHLWLPGGARGVFNAAALHACTEIVLAKSIVDALTLWCAGVRNVTACFSGFALHDDLRAVLAERETKRVLIAFDRRKAADVATEALADDLSEQGIEAFRVLMPNSMDVNDFARSVESPTDALQQAVRSAVWMRGGAKPISVPAQLVPASAPAPPAPAPESEPPADKRDGEIVLHFGDRRWRIRGLHKNMSYEQLRVNLLVSKQQAQNGAPRGFHVDVVELYSARQRAAFAKQASDELAIDEQTIKHDLGRVLTHLEQVQDEQIKAELQPKTKTPVMSDEDRAAALQLLRDPDLLQRVSADLERCGLIGESTNKLAAYLGTVSRKLRQPLGIVVQSSSAAGKTSLMDAVLAFVPEEERVHFSAMTGQSLFYMGESDLAHRVLAIAEEAGARRSSYALKLLQSEGELTIASTGKDPGTGRLVSQEYRVRGPVQLMLTTTAIDLDEELLNRCVILTVDEGREQTQRIHEEQRHRQTLEGLLARQEREAITRLHQNAQRLLRSVHVVNPFAAELKFFDGQARSRRDHAKYLTLINAVTLLHQLQRPAKVIEHQGHRFEYIEVTQADIDIANTLAAEIIGGDEAELPPQTKKLLDSIKNLVLAIAAEQSMPPAEVKLTARMIREHVGLSPTPTKRHLRRLVDMEFIIAAAGPKRRTFYQYDAHWAQLEAGLAHPALRVSSPPPSPNEQSDSAAIVSVDSPVAMSRRGSRGKPASYTRRSRPKTARTKSLRSGAK